MNVGDIIPRGLIKLSECDRDIILQERERQCVLERIPPTRRPSGPVKVREVRNSELQGGRS